MGFSIFEYKIFTNGYSGLRQHKGLIAIKIFPSLNVAFSIGANNVANVAVPIASLTANEIGQESIQNFLPNIILSVLIVAPCFAIGSSPLGHKVTKSTGKDIVEVSPFYGTIIALITASLLLLASITKGIPTSLVQFNEAAFIALIISKNGFKDILSNKNLKRLFIVWGISPTVAYIFTYAFITLLT